MRRFAYYDEVANPDYILSFRLALTKVKKVPVKRQLKVGLALVQQMLPIIIRWLYDNCGI